jgi:hypothetical protein
MLGFFEMVTVLCRLLLCGLLSALFPGMFIIYVFNVIAVLRVLTVIFCPLRYCPACHIRAN